jgi:hypothetical protein
MVRAMDWDDSHNPGKMSKFKKYNERQEIYRVSRNVTSRNTPNFKISNFKDAVNRSVDVTDSLPRVRISTRVE